MESKYREQFNTDVIKLGSQGSSKTQIAANLGVTCSSLDYWAKKHPEFKEGLEIALTLAEAYWESIGQKGTKGMLPKFTPASWIYMMKCRYRDNWKDDSNQRIELHNTVKSLTDDELEDALKSLVAAKSKPKTGPEGAAMRLN